VKVELISYIVLLRYPLADEELKICGVGIKEVITLNKSKRW
jgi:hypothetical protein